MAIAAVVFFVLAFVFGWTGMEYPCILSIALFITCAFFAGVQHAA